MSNAHKCERCSELFEGKPEYGIMWGSTDRKGENWKLKNFTEVVNGGYLCKECNDKISEVMND